MIPWPRKATGNSPLVDTINRLIDRAHSTEAIDSSGVKYNKTLRGTSIAVLGGGGVSKKIQVAQFIVKEIQDDYLNCLKYSSTAGELPASATSDDWIKVAKPFELRFTDWDGQTVDGLTFSYALVDFDWARRRATRVSDDVSEIQIIARPWYVGEIIYAIKGISGGTFAFDADEVPISWLDLNNTARAWAKTPNTDPIDATL